MTERQELTFVDLIRPIMPAVIRNLMKFAKVSTQRALADLLDSRIDANSISRYKKGKVPLWNLPKMCSNVGLTSGETAWMIGKLMMEENEEHSFDLDAEQPSEIREPQPRYGERKGNLETEFAVVMELDFSRLEPEEMFALTRERNALHAASKELQEEIEEAAGRLDRKIAALVTLLVLFRKRAMEAIRKAQVGK